IKEILRKHYQEFVNNLKKVKGAVELGLKVFWEADKMKKKAKNYANKRIKQVSREATNAAVNRPRSTGSGSRYLLKKMKNYFLEEGLEQEAEKLAENIDKKLLKHALDSRLKKLATEGLALNASYLVPKENCQDFENEVAKMQKENKNLKFLFSGPWPAYNFIDVKVN
ncbi:GvpL/GvpF family gas vesicle protein, partial [Candidatus Parcubacteria bacterium]|nr:GvpL/GvpF family gas vesicle protein [Candidatus Parcubacteria bacterium]